MRLKTLEQKIRYRIAKSKDNVFILEDFGDLSGRDQVSRTLRNLIADGQLAKIGYGLYAKSRYSDLFNKNMLTKDLPSLAKEGLKKLGVETYPTKYERLYLSGKSTQVPSGSVIGVKERVSRTISYNDWTIQYERV